MKTSCCRKEETKDQKSLILLSYFIMLDSQRLMAIEIRRLNAAHCIWWCGGHREQPAHYRSSFTAASPSGSVLPKAPLHTAESPENVSGVRAGTSPVWPQHRGGYPRQLGPSSFRVSWTESKTDGETEFPSSPKSTEQKIQCFFFFWCFWIFSHRL